MARKRLNSDDKYDNKEYIEKMEAQLDQMIRKQFPVEDDDMEDDTRNRWMSWSMEACRRLEEREEIPMIEETSRELQMTYEISSAEKDQFENDSS